MKTNKNNTVMKKIATVLALVSLLGVLAVSCQKETTGNPLPAVVTRTVDYCIGDNAPQQTVLHGDVQWQSFLAAIFDSVDRGYRVSLIHGGAAAKEAVTFSTTVKADAIAWVDSMYNAGYDVTLWYDDTTGQYNAVAQKSTAPGPITPDRPYYPLADYLQGTWSVAKNCVVMTNYWLATGESQEYQDNMSWEQSLLFYWIKQLDYDFIDVPARHRTIQFTADSFFVEEQAYFNDSESRYMAQWAAYTVTDSTHISFSGKWVRANQGFDTVDFSGILPIYEWNTDTIILHHESHLYTWGEYYETLLFVRNSDR